MEEQISEKAWKNACMHLDRCENLQEDIDVLLGDVVSPVHLRSTVACPHTSTYIFSQLTRRGSFRMLDEHNWRAVPSRILSQAASLVNGAFSSSWECAASASRMAARWRFNGDGSVRTSTRPPAMDKNPWTSSIRHRALRGEAAGPVARSPRAIRTTSIR